MIKTIKRAVSKIKEVRKSITDKIHEFFAIPTVNKVSWGTHIDACIYADCGWDSIISNYFFQYGMSNKLKYISREFSLSLNENVYPSSMHCIIRDNDGARCNALYTLEDSGIDKQFFCNCDFNNVLALKSIVESVFTTEFNRYQQIRF